MPQWVAGVLEFLLLVGFFNLPILDFRSFLSFLLHSHPTPFQTTICHPHSPLPPCSPTAFECSGLEIVVAGGVLLPPE
ncbi:hypothetical protein RHMOL_Rhmol13G0119000 [Rhododendron molle]|uniref:Uncharacterized protein n=1 Tax=Rhododendron molle TaxID=49168 RepID=A0ACC0L6S4_RHOML|nr:hypothetical protein RHMOL_Rhmol13G0119000 [Rhododendron molle]